MSGEGVRSGEDSQRAVWRCGTAAGTGTAPGCSGHRASRGGGGGGASCGGRGAFLAQDAHASLRVPRRPCRVGGGEGRAGGAGGVGRGEEAGGEEQGGAGVVDGTVVQQCGTPQQFGSAPDGDRRCAVADGVQEAYRLRGAPGEEGLLCGAGVAVGAQRAVRAQGGGPQVGGPAQGGRGVGGRVGRGGGQGGGEGGVGSGGGPGAVQQDGQAVVRGQCARQRVMDGTAQPGRCGGVQRAQQQGAVRAEPSVGGRAQGVRQGLCGARVQQRDGPVHGGGVRVRCAGGVQRGGDGQLKCAPLGREPGEVGAEGFAHRLGVGDRLGQGPLAAQLRCGEAAGQCEQQRRVALGLGHEGVAYGEVDSRTGGLLQEVGRVVRGERVEAEDGQSREVPVDGPVSGDADQQYDAAPPAGSRRVAWVRVGDGSRAAVRVQAGRGLAQHGAGGGVPEVGVVHAQQERAGTGRPVKHRQEGVGSGAGVRRTRLRRTEIRRTRLRRTEIRRAGVRRTEIRRAGVRRTEIRGEADGLRRADPSCGVRRCRPTGHPGCRGRPGPPGRLGSCGLSGTVQRRGGFSGPGVRHRPGRPVQGAQAGVRLVGVGRVVPYPEHGSCPVVGACGVVQEGGASAARFGGHQVGAALVAQPVQQRGEPVAQGAGAVGGRRRSLGRRPSGHSRDVTQP
ncbi:hypothetical protein GCM10020256_03430 [Streptomyces thermocoprophilus]